MKTTRRLAAASLAAAAVLSTTACGGPSPETVSRTVIEHLLAGEKQEAYEYMTDDYREHAENLSAIDLLGARDMIDCELGEGNTRETGSGAAATDFPLECTEAESVYTLTVTTTGTEHLVDDIAH